MPAVRLLFRSDQPVQDLNRVLLDRLGELGTTNRLLHLGTGSEISVSFDDKSMSRPTLSLRPSHLKPPARYRDRFLEHAIELPQRQTQFDERAQEHVAGDAGSAVQIRFHK